MSTSGNQLFNFGNPQSSSGMGGNQWMDFASLPNMTPQTSGAIPSPNAANSPTMPSSGGQPGLAPVAPSTGVPAGTPQKGVTAPSTTKTGTGQYAVGQPQDPQLTNNLFSWLNSQIGQGASAYPGTLTAQNNPLIQMLMQSFGQKGGPLNSMINTGDPIDQTPAWEAMVQSMQNPIQQNEAQLREQASVGGDLVGSTLGTSMSNYLAQVTTSENAQLIQAQTQALEQAQGRKLSSNEFMGQFGQYLQGLDQSSIDRMYQEYIRTSPDYSPLLQNEQAAAAQYPPYLKTETGMQQFLGSLGGIGSILSAFRK